MEEELTNLSIKELVVKAIDSRLGLDEQLRVKELLGSMYTSMIQKCIDNTITEDSNLTFQNEEKLKIDMGLISDEAYVSEKSRRAIQEAWNDRTPPYRLKYFYFSDWLEEFYLNNHYFGVNYSKQLESRISELENGIFQNQLELINLQQNVDELLEQLSGMHDIDTSLQERLETYILSRDIDRQEEKLLNNILEAKWKQKHGAMMNKEENMNLSKNILEQSKAKALRGHILNDLEMTCGSSLITKQLLDFYDMIEKLKTDLFMSEKAKDSLVDGKFVFEKNIPDYSLPKRIEIMKKEVNRIQVLLNTCGIRGGIKKPLSVHISKQFVKIQEAITVIDKFNENDPTLFYNSYRKRVGLPSILLVPGQGNGMYDVENNCMLLPFFPHNLEDSVVYMLADYRLAVGEKNDLMKSFKEALGPGKDMESSFAYKDLFKQYYKSWMLKEAHGYKGLDQNIRKWFEKYIALKNNQIKIPYDMLVVHLDNFPDMEIKLEGELLKKNPDPSLIYLKLGVIKTILERRPDESLKCFQQALTSDPGLHDAEYNIAQTYVTMGKIHLAKDYFQKYTSHNYDTRWTVIARTWL